MPQKHRKWTLCGLAYTVTCDICICVCVSYYVITHHIVCKVLLTAQSTLAMYLASLVAYAELIPTQARSFYVLHAI